MELLSWHCSDVAVENAGKVTDQSGDVIRLGRAVTGLSSAWLLSLVLTEPGQLDGASGSGRGRLFSAATPPWDAVSRPLTSAPPCRSALGRPLTSTPLPNLIVRKRSDWDNHRESTGAASDPGQQKSPSTRKDIQLCTS